MSAKTVYPKGLSELRSVRNENQRLFASVGLFSVFVNLLMLTGPVYMLQVYDRVLGSRSEETLVALSILVALLYTLMGFLDYARGRVLARVGARFQSRLDKRVFDAILRRASLPGQGQQPASGLRDLEAVQRLLSSPALFAVFDIPWTPIFIGAIFLFHPWLGYLALAGGGLLISVTVLNLMMTRNSVHQANVSTAVADAFATQVQEEAELVQGLGMQNAVLSRWNKFRGRSLEATILSSDRTGGFSALSKSFRFFLQSAMLGLGAYLVLQGEITAGAMIAGSILMGRALAPIEQAIGQWPLVQRAQQGWSSLSELLEKTPVEPQLTQLPKPKALLVAQNITAVPPGEQQACLRMINFDVQPGTALGVIGQSAAGKSSLARIITGIWQPVSGKIRLDGAALDQYSPEDLGRYVGYLPQTVTLFNATIAENIARMSEAPDDKLVVEAAKCAGAHDMILKMPEGYNTVIGHGGGRLSGGQKQRLGLARALYGNPVILVLDEPNSNLDSLGSQALNTAIRQMKQAGRSVIIMAHRPAAIAECDTLLVLENGLRKAYGPRDEVLQANVQNVAQITDAIGKSKNL